MGPMRPVAAGWPPASEACAAPPPTTLRYAMQSYIKLIPCMRYGAPVALGGRGHWQRNWGVQGEQRAGGMIGALMQPGQVGLESRRWKALRVVQFAGMKATRYGDHLVAHARSTCSGKEGQGRRRNERGHVGQAGRGGVQLGRTSRDKGSNEQGQRATGAAAAVGSMRCVFTVRRRRSAPPPVGRPEG